MYYGRIDIESNLSAVVVFALYYRNAKSLDITVTRRNDRVLASKLEVKL